MKAGLFIPAFIFDLSPSVIYTVNKRYCFGEISMAQRLDDSELVSFKELLLANSIQVDALARLLIEKDIITQDEFFTKLKLVQAEYMSKQND